MSMLEMPDGVKYSDNGKGTQNLLTAAVAFAGGVVVDQLWNNKKGYGHGGHGDGHCGYNGGCSENTPVNRFELEQSQKLAASEAIIAKLQGEIFTTDKIALAKAELSLAFTREIDRTNDAVKHLASGLSNVQLETVRVADKVSCLGDAIVETNRNFAQRMAEAARYNDAEFLHRPKVEVCCNAEFAGCCKGNDKE